MYFAIGFQFIGLSVSEDWPIARHNRKFWLQYYDCSDEGLVLMIYKRAGVVCNEVEMLYLKIDKHTEVETNLLIH
jgi:hypothetical protein